MRSIPGEKLVDCILMRSFSQPELSDIPIQIGHFVSHDYTVGQGGFRTVFWEVSRYSRDLLAAIEDIVVFLNYLQKCYRDLNQGATAQLLVMCNRTAVHTQLLQHGFQAAWFGGLRIATTSSAAGATVRIVVQTRMWFPQWGPVRGNGRRQRELLWTSHCRAHQSHPAYCRGPSIAAMF